LSFSGLKTALIYKKNELQHRGLFNRTAKIKLISSFQAAAVEAVVSIVQDAAKQCKLGKVACGGGVIANRYLRQKLLEVKNIKFLIAPFEYTGDNAAIVAGLGFYLYNKKGLESSLAQEAEAN
jgi:N6-L-threonylcarbamoyladenine synthase